MYGVFRVPGVFNDLSLRGWIKPFWCLLLTSQVSVITKEFTDKGRTTTYSTPYDVGCKLWVEKTKVQYRIGIKEILGQKSVGVYRITDET